MQLRDRQKKLPIPSPEEMEMATESSRILAAHFNSQSNSQQITVKFENGKEQPLSIPSVAYELFIDILSQMSQGNAVTLVPVQAELSTQQAANLLNVSRPYLIKLLESNTIPHHKVGKHRRILAQDLYEYKSNLEAKRSKSLDELTSLSQEMGLYED